MRAKHYEELLKIYHDSLRELLDCLGGDTDTQFPFSALTSQLKQFGKFGIIMSSVVVPFTGTKSEDLPDMDFMAENMAKDNPEMMNEMMTSWGSKNESFVPRLRGNLLDSIRYGYL